MSRVVHQVIVSLTFDKAVPPRQASGIIARLFAGETLEKAIYEESVKHGNNAAPVFYSATPLSFGMLKPVAEATDFSDPDEDEVPETPDTSSIAAE